MKAGKKAAFIFALWVGLSGIWFASSASAQSANLLEANQLYTQAMQLQQQGRHSEALPFAEKALAILEKEMGTEHPHVASAINSVALLHSAIGNYPQAETLYKRSLAITEKTFGSDHLNVGIIVRNLADLYLTSGNYSTAETLYQRSLKIFEIKFGPEHVNVAYVLNNLGGTYFSMGNYAAAEPLHKRCLQIRERKFGPEHPDVGESLNNLAMVYEAMGNYAAAEPLYKRSLSIAEKNFGPNHSRVFATLTNWARLYEAMGNYAAAEPLYKRSLSIRERLLGADDPNLADSLRSLAELYRAMGRYEEAETLCKRSLSIREKAFGAFHPYVGESLNDLAVIYTAMRKESSAEPLYERSLNIFEKALGPDNPSLIQNIRNLAGSYITLGKYSSAELLYKRSLGIREKALGHEHPDVAQSLNDIAALYHIMGNYAAAEPLYQRSLTIREKKLGSEHLEVAISLNNLSVLYRKMGNYAAAEPLLKRSIKITENKLGSEHFEVAVSLNNLALIYRNMGNYAAAEPLYKRSLTIYEKVLDPEDPAVATPLNNLAQLYEDMGNFAAAEPLLRRSLAIMEKELGPEHPDVATSLTNLAGLYLRMGNYSAAEPFCKRSLAISEKELGPEHPDVATSLNNLAVLYHEIGNYAAAEPLLKRSLVISEKKLGPEHPVVATGLNNLGEIYNDMGRYDAAEPLYKRSLAIAEKALGPVHPNVGTILKNLATLKAALGNNRQSLDLMTRNQAINEGMIEQIAGFTSGAQTMQYLTTIQFKMDICLSLVSSRMKDNGVDRKEAYGVWLRRKGVLLEAQRRMQQALIEAGDHEAAKVFEELSQTRARLAELTFAGPGKEKPEIYQKMLKELNIQKDELESKLSRLSQAYAQARKARKVTVEDVAKALPPDAALIDVARINVFDFNAKGNEKKWLPAHYLAFVLRSGQGQDVALLDLGAADEIDEALNQLKHSLTQKQEANARNLGRKLHDLIFLPLQKELGGAQRVFLSPDGALNLLPFEILRDPQGRYLIEKYTFNYLAAGRDLVGFGEKKASTEKPLLLGDPDFDLDPNKKSQALDRLGMQTNTAVAAVRSVEKLSLPFERLKGTGEEVNAIGDLLGRGQCEVFLESSALEEVLQSRRAPRILHLATHGFFLEDQQWSAMGDFRGIGGTVSFVSMEQPFARPLGPKVNLENPLLRSGIALAGANRAGSSGQGSDGILTADEVLGLRLRGTELVVLSACETGLGEVKTGEGVFGLRRAFTQAGAKSLVMSMWKVPDAPTKDLMVEFYKNILSGKLDRCQSLRQAALKMKQKYGDNPYYWGAFVFLGQAD